MPMSRLPVLTRRTRGHAGLVAALIALAILVLTPATARALTVDIAWPASVTVGQTGVVGHVTLTNTLDGPATVCDQSECSSEGIIVIPSCASASAAPVCDAPDPGVFSVASTAAIPLGSPCGASPLVTSFDVVVAEPARRASCASPPATDRRSCSDPPAPRLRRATSR